MATHSSTLACKIPWTEEPGGLQSMSSLRVIHNWATSLSLFTFMHWRRKWQPTPVFLPGESRDGGAWWAGVYGVAQSRTRLMQLNSSSSSSRTKRIWSVITAKQATVEDSQSISSNLMLPSNVCKLLWKFKAIQYVLLKATDSSKFTSFNNVCSCLIFLQISSLS